MHRMKLFKLGAPLLGLLVLLSVLWLQPSTPEPSADELAELAIGYVKTNHDDLAEATFQRAFDRDALNFRAHYGAAHFAMRRKRYKEAELHLQAAYKIKPNDVDTVLTLGAVYMKMGAYPQAESLFSAVRKIQPGNASAVYNLGMLEIERRRYQPAKGHLEEYLKMVPNAPDRRRVNRNILLLEAYIKDEAKP